MQLVITAIVLAILAAVVDYFFGIQEPWRKLIYAGIVILFIVAIILLVIPGLFSGRLASTDAPFQVASATAHRLPTSTT